MPYVGSLPKSGCRFVAAAFIAAKYVDEFGSSGADEMSAFQGLSAGKTWQPATVGTRAADVGVLVAAGVADDPVARTAAGAP
jgi:hypothetical protein